MGAGCATANRRTDATARAQTQPQSGGFGRETTRAPGSSRQKGFRRPGLPAMAHPGKGSGLPWRPFQFSGERCAADTRSCAASGRLAGPCPTRRVIRCRSQAKDHSPPTGDGLSQSGALWGGKAAVSRATGAGTAAVSTDRWGVRKSGWPGNVPARPLEIQTAARASGPLPCGGPHGLTLV